MPPSFEELIEMEARRMMQGNPSLGATAAENLDIHKTFAKGEFGVKDLSYRSLQKWAKEKGIKANQRKAVLLRAWNKAQGLGKQTTMFGVENPKTVMGGRRATFNPASVGSVMGGSPLGEPSLASLGGRGGVASGIYPGSPYSSAFREGTVAGRRPIGMGGTKLDPAKFGHKPGVGTPMLPTVGGKPLSGFQTAKELAGKGKGFLRFLGPAANTLFLGMMLFDLIRRGGGFGAGTEQDAAALAVAQGGIVPGMQQRGAVATDISRQQMGVTQMEGLAEYARIKQQGIGEFQRGMSAELDNIVAMKQGRLARASFMSPDIQQHLANLVSTGNL